MTLMVQTICLFFGIWFTSVNLAKVYRGHAISMINFVIMSAAWTEFIMVTWLI